MRDDFSKLLVERERIHHKDHYHNYRHMKGPKGLDDDEVGGRESMRKRYNYGYDRKHFNENLNPLYGWLRSCVGKKWDKCYSELCKKFDMRGVINAHILQHLWQSVEKHAFIDPKGAVMVHKSYFWGGKDNPRGGAVPISQCGKDYYICPKDGTLKRTVKLSKRSVSRQKEAEKRRQELAVKRVLNDREVLHLIDGVWYHFELLSIPPARIEYKKPLGVDVFKTGYQFLGNPNNRRKKTWDELNQQEREKFGVAVVVGNTAYDEFTGKTIWVDQKGYTREGAAYAAVPRYSGMTKSKVYHANKKTASKKHLKQAGLL